MLGQSAINRNIVTTAVHRTEREHGPAVSFDGGLFTELHRRRRVLWTATTIHQHLGQGGLALRDAGLCRARKPFPRRLWVCLNAATFVKQPAQHELRFRHAFSSMPQPERRLLL